mmetsp:Transcript_135895/g.338923  ORF Transcript_135895/g.338923 Transcript_135895/m.338923 type:complete len:202 (-) Transcript_135895:177-782(-)
MRTQAPTAKAWRLQDIRWPQIGLQPVPAQPACLAWTVLGSHNCCCGVLCAYAPGTQPVRALCFLVWARELGCGMMACCLAAAEAVVVAVIGVAADAVVAAAAQAGVGRVAARPLAPARQLPTWMSSTSLGLCGRQPWHRCEGRVVGLPLRAGWWPKSRGALTAFVGGASWVAAAVVWWEVAAAAQAGWVVGAAWRVLAAAL